MQSKIDRHHPKYAGTAGASLHARDLARHLREQEHDKQADAQPESITPHEGPQKEFMDSDVEPMPYIGGQPHGATARVIHSLSTTIKPRYKRDGTNVLDTRKKAVQIAACLMESEAQKIVDALNQMEDPNDHNETADESNNLGTYPPVPPYWHVTANQVTEERKMLLDQLCMRFMDIHPDENAMLAIAENIGLLTEPNTRIRRLAIGPVGIVGCKGGPKCTSSHK